MANLLSTESTIYRYKIVTMDLLIPEQDPISIDVSEIESFAIEKAFDTDYFPILYFGLRLSPSKYFKIIKNKTTAKFRIRLDSEKFDPKSGETSSPTMIFNDLFCIVTSDETENISEEMHRQTTETLGSESDMSFYSKVYEFYFFKEKDLLASKKVINEVISYDCMQNVVTYCLSKSGINKVLMTPINNNRMYKEIVIYPVPLIQNIQYLEEQYGFYNYGGLFFFDFDKVYFIDKQPEATAYQTMEYTMVKINIFNTNNVSSITTGSFKNDEEKNYTIHVSENSMSTNNLSTVSDQTYGNNLIVVDTKENSINPVSPNTDQLGSGTERVVLNEYSNKYTTEAAKHRKNENNFIINLKLSDVDISCLAPNKKFMFLFENSKINIARGGAYRLSHMAFTFKRIGNVFNIVGSATFKKSK